jgi:hypothetical protein
MFVLRTISWVRCNSVDVRIVSGADSWIKSTGEAAVTYQVASVDELQDIDYRQDTHHASGASPLRDHRFRDERLDSCKRG